MDYLKRFDNLKLKSLLNENVKHSFKRGYNSNISVTRNVDEIKDFLKLDEDEINKLSTEQKGRYISLADDDLAWDRIEGALIYEKLGLGNRASVKRRVLKGLERRYHRGDNATQKELKEVRSFLERNSDTGTSIEKKLLNSFFGVLISGGLFFGINGFTGAVIGASQKSSFFIGGMLFIAGIAGLFFSRK